MRLPAVFVCLAVVAICLCVLREDGKLSLALDRSAAHGHAADGAVAPLAPLAPEERGRQRKRNAVYQ